MRTSFPALIAAVSLVGAAVPAAVAPPANAHTIACANKGVAPNRVVAKCVAIKCVASKRVCARRAAAHRRAHRKASSARRETARKPGPAPAPAPAPVVAPAPAPITTSPSAITSWRAPGASPLSDADAAARVSPAVETRPANAGANAYRPTAAELDTFRNGQRDTYNRTALMYNRLTAYVTGGFSGTTDEILQWVAHKWGIPEDIVRSVATTESSWNMSQLGDLTTVSDPASYPAFSRVGTTSAVYQSVGIMQIRWTPQGLHVGTEPLRWKSTAFNADYWGAVIRYYYDGLCDWCGAGYSAGQAWASIGAWYNPSPWDTGSQTYQDLVKAQLAALPWTQPGF